MTFAMFVIDQGKYLAICKRCVLLRVLMEDLAAEYTNQLPKLSPPTCRCPVFLSTHVSTSRNESESTGADRQAKYALKKETDVSDYAI